MTYLKVLKKLMLEGKHISYSPAVTINRFIVVTRWYIKSYPRQYKKTKEPELYLRGCSIAMAAILRLDGFIVMRRREVTA